VVGITSSLVPDPALIVDQLVLHDCGLPGQTAEGLKGDLEPGPGGLTQRAEPLALRRAIASDFSGITTVMARACSRLRLLAPP
jgi:hypothetical protein